jgi:hypothetical protein
VRRSLPLVAVVAVLIAAFAGQALAGPGGYPAVAGNPADRLLKTPIDPYEYDYSKQCRKHPSAGILALQGWLEKNAKGSFWGNMRCEKLSANNFSLHSDGRALDWHLSVHVASDRAEAKRLIGLLLAPDRAGNVHALARRMGVQEIIWDCQGWFSGDGGMRPYSVCYDKNGKPKKVDDTSAHRDHIHLGMNWPGAKLRSSFWSR